MEAFHAQPSYGSIDAPSPSELPRKKIVSRCLGPVSFFIVMILLFTFMEHRGVKRKPSQPLLGSPSSTGPIFSLLLLRHAKVLEDDQLKSEFEKPLDSTGEHEAKWVGDMLRKADIPSPDTILSSSSVPARETLDLVAKHAQWNNQLPPVQYAAEWYDLAFDGNHGYREYLASILNSSPYRRVMLVGHNPAIQLLVNQLLPVTTFIQVPTGSFIEIQFSTLEDWSEINHAVGAMCMFLNPINRT